MPVDTILELISFWALQTAGRRQIGGPRGFRVKGKGGWLLRCRRREPLKGGVADGTLDKQHARRSPCLSHYHPHDLDLPVHGTLGTCHIGTSGQSTLRSLRLGRSTLHHQPPTLQHKPLNLHRPAFSAVCTACFRPPSPTQSTHLEQGVDLRLSGGPLQLEHAICDGGVGQRHAYGKAVQLPLHVHAYGRGEHVSCTARPRQ